MLSLALYCALNLACTYLTLPGVVLQYDIRPTFHERMSNHGSRNWHRHLKIHQDSQGSQQRCPGANRNRTGHGFEDR
jgi:hypothetical protein